MQMNPKNSGNAKQRGKRPSIKQRVTPYWLDPKSVFSAHRVIDHIYLIITNFPDQAQQLNLVLYIDVETAVK